MCVRGGGGEGDLTFVALSLSKTTSHIYTLSLSLSLSHIHTHAHTHSLAPSLALSLSLSHTHPRAHTYTCKHLCGYGVATISRLLKIVGLFCRISSLLYGSFAKETYNFKEPTNRSHPIAAIRSVFICELNYLYLT